MKYEKKGRVVDAIQFKNLRDAQEIIDKVPSILGVADVWISTDDPVDDYIILRTFSDYLWVPVGDYVMWSGEKVTVVPKEKFEKKYREAWPIGFITSTGTLSGGYVYTGASSANSPGVVTGKPL